MPDVPVLEVHLHGRKIATLTHVGGDRTLFAFTDEYIHDQNRSLLGLGFKDPLGQLVTDFNPTQTKLIPWFSNLLPEGPLRHYLLNVPALRACVNSFYSGYLVKTCQVRLLFNLLMGKSSHQPHLIVLIMRKNFVKKPCDFPWQVCN